MDDVPQIARCFDRTTKLGFKDPDQPQFVKFGNFKDNDATLGIRRGQLRLLGYTSFSDMLAKSKGLVFYQVRRRIFLCPFY